MWISLWPEAALGLMLIVFGVFALRWQRAQVLRNNADPHVTAEDTQYFDAQTRRRTRVSWLLMSTGVLLPACSAALEIWKNPSLGVALLMLILVQVLAIVGLALSDLNATTGYRRRALGRIEQIRRQEADLARRAAAIKQYGVGEDFSLN